VRTDILMILNNFLADCIVDDNEAHKTKQETSLKAANAKEKEATYVTDILIAKKSSFEAKLFSKLLAPLGYKFDVAKDAEELFSLVKEKSYKLVIFDKGIDELNLSKFSKFVEDIKSQKNIKTNLILIHDALSSANNEDAQYVDEIINNEMSKDLLRLMCEKFI
jgi:PleD family two-component response regulator